MASNLLPVPHLPPGAMILESGPWVCPPHTAPWSLVQNQCKHTPSLPSGFTEVPTWQPGFPPYPGWARLPESGPDPCAPLWLTPLHKLLPASSVLSPGPARTALPGSSLGSAPPFSEFSQFVRLLPCCVFAVRGVPSRTRVFRLFASLGELHADRSQFLRPANVHLPRRQALRGHTSG